jgi:HAD superfamily hydrolase (TIGR01509 family)
VSPEWAPVAVLFDLDDTLFPQVAWLDGAWVAVADEAARWGIDRVALLDALRATAAQGSAAGRIIDRALEAVGGAPAAPVDRLVSAFRAHRPATLDPYPGVREALAALRAVSLLGVVTDGEVAIQAAKLVALGLDAAFDVVVVSDSLGRVFRKPHRAPFLLALERLDAAARDAVFVGDCPAKDMAGACGVGMRTIRVRTGEYAALADDPPSWRAVGTVAEAAAAILRLPNVGHRPIRVDGGAGTKSGSADCSWMRLPATPVVNGQACWASVAADWMAPAATAALAR